MRTTIMVQETLYLQQPLVNWETNLSFTPSSVPHGEVVVIDCTFNISLDSVGLISIETTPENQWEAFVIPSCSGIYWEEVFDVVMNWQY